MASKGKVLFKFLTGDILASDTFSSHDIYGITLNQKEYNKALPEEFFKSDKIGSDWWNISARKKDSLYGLVGVFYNDPNIGKSVGDHYNEYKKCIYLPTYSSFFQSSSITGKKIPIGSKYPTYIDFNSVSFVSTLLAYKNLARKTNKTLSQTYKQHIIKSASTIIAKYITRMDKYYLNPYDLEFYDVKTHQRVNPYVPDEQIFRPFTSRYQVSKQDILREWYKFRYFGSNLMLPQFVPNEEKKEKWIQSQVKENEEFIDCLEINYDNLDDNILTKFVLGECMTDFYDFNDDLTIEVEGNTYKVDVRNSKFTDVDDNEVPYIPIYNDDTGLLEYALSFNEYTNLLKETLTDDDKDIQQKVVEALQNDTALPNSQNVYPDKLSLLKWKDYFYYDTSKSGKHILWYGKYKIQYTRAVDTYSVSESQDILWNTLETNTETITYSFSLDEITNTALMIKNRSVLFTYYDGGNSYDLSAKNVYKTNIPLNIEEALCKWLYENMTGEEDEDLSKIKVTSGISYYIKVHGYTYWNDDGGGQSSYVGYTHVLCDSNYKAVFAKSVTYVKADRITSVTFTETRQKYQGQTVFEYKEGVFLKQQDATYNFIRSYNHHKFMLELFGPATITSGIDKSNAKYNLVDTYFHEMLYEEGDVWNLVTIRPIFTIPNVTCKNELNAEVEALTYHKKIYTEDEYKALSDEDKEDVLVDDNGQYYVIERRGSKIEEQEYDYSESVTQIRFNAMTDEQKAKLVKNTDGSYYMSDGKYLYSEKRKTTETYYDVYDTQKKTQAEVDAMTAEEKQNLLTDTDGEYVKDEDGNYIYQIKTGCFSVSKEYNEQPYASYMLDNYEELVKFSLPLRQLKIYSKLSNYIKKLKSGSITGYILVYKDLDDGKTKTRHINISSNDYNLAVCDLQYDIVKCLPLVPLYNTTCTIDSLIQSKIVTVSPEVYIAAATYASSASTSALVAYAIAWLANFAAFMLPFAIPAVIMTAKWKLGFLGFHKNKKPQRFYYYYDKKVNLYYKNAFNYYLKEWEKVLNNNYTDDTFTDNDGKTVKVKMNKKVSRRFTNENAVTYSEGFLEKPKETVNDYDTYVSNFGLFGAHTSIRFSFSIYFNRHFRATRLISRMGFIYLDYFFNKLGGTYGLWYEQQLYPPDRIHYPEKQIKLRFKKDKVDTSVEGGNASDYCEFRPNDGQLCFYKRSKKERITLDMNTYCPQWRSIYFSGKNTYQKAFSQMTTLEKIDSIVVAKSDLQPLTYTDSFTTKLYKDIPVTKYSKTTTGYQITLNTLFYGVPLVVKYTTIDGKQKQRTIDIWSKAKDGDYCCYYKPYDLNEYTFDENLYQTILDNFTDTNVTDYITNLIVGKSTAEIEDMYNTTFSKTIDVIEQQENMFNYNGVFDDLTISQGNTDNFKTQDTDELYKAYTFNQFPNYSGKEVSRHQSYWLALNYNSSCAILQSDVNTDSIKTKRNAAKEIALHLLKNEYFPLNRLLTPLEWQDAFINYDKDTLLGQLFSEREVYEIGFYNYLVTNDTTATELTLLIEQICKIDRTFIYDMGNLKEGEIKYHSVYLPMPVDVYKKFPLYSKNLMSSLFCLLEQYQVQAIGSVRESSVNMAKTHTAISIINAIGQLIVSLVATIASCGAATPYLVFVIIYIAGQICIIISYLMQLVAMFLPTAQSRKLQNAAKYVSYAGTALSIIGSICSLVSGGIILRPEQWVSLGFQSASYITSIVEKSLVAKYEKKTKEDNARLNVAITNYNSSIDELYEFTEQYEFEGALFDQYQPTNIKTIETNIFDDTYDSSIESFVDGSLEALYADLDGYYSNRID